MTASASPSRPDAIASLAGGSPASIHAPTVTMRAISKRFGQVKANRQVDLEIFPSQVLALLGENGAGKSTLMKILYGFYRSDEGAIEINGVPVAIHSPQDARTHRIGMVFQTFNLIPAFTVSENIGLFLEDLGLVLNPSGIAERIDEMASRFGMQVDPGALVMDLSIGEQQKVEILKLLVSGARLLILDEPTRVLAPHEIESLLGVLDRLRSDGYAIVLITHKLKEVFKIADRVAVMRAGEMVETLTIDAATEDHLVELMFSRQVREFEVPLRSPQSTAGTPLLFLDRVSTVAQGAGVALQQVTLEVHRGQIVGITGVSGNGQRELADVVLGRLATSGGAIRLSDEPIRAGSVTAMRRRGVAFIPENPMAMAIAPFLTVVENAAVPQSWRYSRAGGFDFDWRAAQRDFSASLNELEFSLPLYATARSLSGGNLQRMVIARELAHHPDLIVASYVTSGLDVRSAVTARQALIRARDRGAGILLFSDDLDELFALSDRLVVLRDGRIRGDFLPSETTYEETGYLMTGEDAKNDG